MSSISGTVRRDRNCNRDPIETRTTQTTTSSSSVVNIGSVAGLVGMKSGTPYAAMKAAMNQLTKNWACEWWGPDDIRVNCVTPWYINTELAQTTLQDEQYKKYI